MNDHSTFIHEIKNSLGNIYSLVEIIDKDPTELKVCMPLIKDSIRQIRSIERDYDEFRKSGKTTIKINTINASSLCMSIVDEYHAAAAEKNIKIKTNCKALKIGTDATKLRQVISNLISNAIKYTKPGGCVLVECGIADKAYISISDTGIGMSPEEIKQLGTMFYRSKKIEVEGTGLGWALIKNIATSLNWEVLVKSNLKATPPFEYVTQVLVRF